MPRQVVSVVLTKEERRTLEILASSRTALYRKVQRARLVLLAAEGMSNTDIAKQVNLSRAMVGKWRQRFVRDRLAGLADRLRLGRPRVYTEVDRLRVVETACTKEPPKRKIRSFLGATHWSVRTLAKATRVKKDAVHQVLRENKLKPHRVGTFSRSPDPDFVAKVIDVVGLCLDPPENAVVLCVDEKPQVQALDRTESDASHAPRADRAAHPRLQTQRHRKVSRCTVGPCGASDSPHREPAPLAGVHRVHEGSFFRPTPRERSTSSLTTPSFIGPRGSKPGTRNRKDRRVAFYFITTYSSWLNLIEVLFNLVQVKVLRRGTFPLKRTLVRKLLWYIDQFNREGKVFQWTKPAEAIFRSLNYQT